MPVISSGIFITLGSNIDIRCLSSEDTMQGLQPRYGSILHYQQVSFLGISSLEIERSQRSRHELKILKLTTQNET